MFIRPLLWKQDLKRCYHGRFTVCEISAVYYWCFLSLKRHLLTQNSVKSKLLVAATRWLNMQTISFPLYNTKICVKTNERSIVIKMHETWNGKKKIPFITFDFICSLAIRTWHYLSSFKSPAHIVHTTPLAKPWSLPRLPSKYPLALTCKPKVSPCVI